MVLDVALGNKIKLVKVDKPQNAIIKFIFNDEDIKKYEIIKSRFPEEICYETEIKKDDLKITDSSSRKGYFILNVDDEKLWEIEKELKNNRIDSLL